MKDITLIIRPLKDGEVYEIHSPSHPHLKIVQRPQPTYQEALLRSMFNMQQMVNPLCVPPTP